MSSVPLCISEDNFATEKDLEKASNLSSWINNANARDIIESYLILCPEQDMRLGLMFKRNYAFTQPPPPCTACECCDSCVRRSTCCPSKIYRQTDTPDFIEYQQIVNVNVNDMLLSYVESLWNPNGIKTGWCPNKLVVYIHPLKTY